MFVISLHSTISHVVDHEVIPFYVIYVYKLELIVTTCFCLQQEASLIISLSC